MQMREVRRTQSPRVSRENNDWKATREYLGIRLRGPLRGAKERDAGEPPPIGGFAKLCD
jgi:hypothetical protein